MFKSKDVSIQVRENLENISLLFERSLRFVVLDGDTSDEEAAAYHELATSMVDIIHGQMLEKIYLTHPELRRPKWALPQPVRGQQEVRLSLGAPDTSKPPMISERQLALRVQEIMLTVNTLLNYCQYMANKESTAPSELKEFRIAVGTTMLSSFDLLQRIYDSHRDIAKFSDETDQ